MERRILKSWYTDSSRGTTTYETRVYTDGSTSCACPGWLYPRKGQARIRKHLRALAGRIADALAAYRTRPRGRTRTDEPREQLAQVPPPAAPPTPPPTPTAPPAPAANPRRQRAISFEEDPE